MPPMTATNEHQDQDGAEELPPEGVVGAADFYFYSHRSEGTGIRELG